MDWKARPRRLKRDIPAQRVEQASQRFAPVPKPAEQARKYPWGAGAKGA